MEGLQHSWKWFLTLGIVLIVLGIAAITLPLIPGLMLVMMIGIILVASGILNAVHAFTSLQWKGFVFQLLSGILFLTIGIMLLSRPGAGLAVLTLLIATLMIIEGVFEIVLASHMPQGSGGGWLIFSGIVAILLGIIVWIQWPVSAVWLIGVIIGVSLLLKGWAVLFSALMMKKIALSS